MSGILCSFFSGSDPELVLNLSNLANPNITSRLTAASWDGIAPVRLVVNPGALLNTLNIPSLTFPNGIFLLVGAGALVGGVRDVNGGPGGDAITTSVPLSIENYGSIKGAGGAGGSGGNATVNRFGSTSTAFGGPRGLGQGFQSLGSLIVDAAAAGDNGDVQVNTTPPGGGDWIVGDSGSATARGGNGGRGGDWRGAGSAGQAGSYSGSYSSASSQPGAAGTAAGLNVRGIANVTWIVRGDA